MRLEIELPCHPSRWSPDPNLKKISGAGWERLLYRDAFLSPESPKKQYEVGKKTESKGGERSLGVQVEGTAS